MSNWPVLASNYPTPYTRGWVISLEEWSRRYAPSLAFQPQHAALRGKAARAAGSGRAADSGWQRGLAGVAGGACAHAVLLRRWHGWLHGALRAAARRALLVCLHAGRGPVA